MIVSLHILNVYDTWKHKIKNFNLNWNIYGKFLIMKILKTVSKLMEFNIISSGQWGTQTGKVKEMYETEVREARRIIDDTAKDRAAAELRAKRAEEETLKFKDKYVFPIISAFILSSYTNLFFILL